MRNNQALSSNALRLLRQLAGVVLSSTRDLVADTGLSPHQGKRAVRELSSSGMISSFEAVGPVAAVPWHWATEEWPGPGPGH